MISKKELKKADALLAKEDYSQIVRCRVSPSLHAKLLTQAKSFGYKNLSEYIRAIVMWAAEGKT